MADDDEGPRNLETICTWSNDPDEARRLFIFVQLGASNDIEKMEMVCRWIKDGTTPNKPNLKTVK